MEYIVIEMTEDDAKLFEEYAHSKKMPLSDLLKEALFAKIENEIDDKLIDDYEKRKSQGDVEYIPFQTIKRNYIN